MDHVLVTDRICDSFAKSVNLSRAEIFDEDLTLAEIMSRSTIVQNSIDLMEGFARVANTLKREHGLAIKLPAYSLDTRISVVLQQLESQVPKEGEV